jgi:acetyl-CoA acetyltransferase
MHHDVFVYDALRTARGKGRGGALHGVKAGHARGWAAGLPETVAGVQLNRFCASGLEADGGAAQFIAGYPGGAAAFVARARELAGQHGPRFDPPKSLREQTMVAADA